MGQLVIDHVDDGVLAALHARARENGCSVEEEARRALEAAVRADALGRLEAVRQKMPAASGEDTLEILRRDRARDDP